jgi:predicted phosphate transport protein (TIGR00153 family)
MAWRDWFKRKPDKFMQMLLDQTGMTVQGLDLLHQYLKQPDSKVNKLLNQLQKEADEQRQIMVEELFKSFITPIDREDIYNLSREMNEVLDYAFTTVDEMIILNVEPTPYMLRMTSLLYDASYELKLSLERVMDNHLTVANDHAQRAKSLENRVESVYREALADLFRGKKNIDHIMWVLKVREIYRHLSNAADREDAAANVLADVVLKMS